MTEYRDRTKIIQNMTAPFPDFPEYTAMLFQQSVNMRDVVVPNFYARSRAGEIFNNPMEKMETVFTTPMWSFTWYKKYAGWLTGHSCDWGKFPHTFEPVPGLEDAMDIALTQAKANVGDGILDVLTFMAELDDTVGTIASTGMKAARIFRALRKANLKALRKELSLKELRDMYLEFRYGLRPIYYDLRSIHDLLVKKRDKNDRRTSRGKHTVSVGTVYSTDVFPYYYLGPSTLHYAEVTYNTERKTDAMARSGILSYVNYDNVFIRILCELGVDRPISAAWELIPFSFMIDWFFNVGQTIQAWEPKPCFTELASWTTTEVKQTKKITVSKVNCYYHQIAQGNQSFDAPTSASFSWIQKARIPNPQLKTYPSFNLKLDAYKIADMVAIYSGLRDSKARDRW